MEAKHSKRAIASGAPASAASEADSAAAAADADTEGSATVADDPYLQQLAFEHVGMYDKSLSASSKASI